MPECETLIHKTNPLFGIRLVLHTPDKYILVLMINICIKLGPTKHFKILYTNSFLDYIRMRCFADKDSSAITHPKVIIVKYK